MLYLPKVAFTFCNITDYIFLPYKDNFRARWGSGVKMTAVEMIF